jgi:hypothetical protein
MYGTGAAVRRWFGMLDCFLTLIPQLLRASFTHSLCNVSSEFDMNPTSSDFKASFESQSAIYIVKRALNVGRNRCVAPADCSYNHRQQKEC